MKTRTRHSLSHPRACLLPPAPCLQLLYDGSDAEAVRLLGTLRHVTLLHIHPPFASPSELERFRWFAEGAGEASTRQWVGQPGNFGLMVKQVSRRRSG